MANPIPLSPNLFVPTEGTSAVSTGAKGDPGGDGSEACTTQSFALRLQGIPSPFWLGGVLVWKLIHAKWAMRKGERKNVGAEHLYTLFICLLLAHVVPPDIGGRVFPTAL